MGCFNTQPPEGGWGSIELELMDEYGFNTQPPEGGWLSQTAPVINAEGFQHTAA